MITICYRSLRVGQQIVKSFLVSVRLQAQKALYFCRRLCSVHTPTICVYALSTLKICCHTRKVSKKFVAAYLEHAKKANPTLYSVHVFHNFTKKFKPMKK
jgi:hypothetical protein